MGSKSEMTSFVHLSDLHLRESPEMTVNEVNPYDRLMGSLESIKQLEYKPKFVVITGDLSENGTTKGYQQLKRFTKELENQNIPTLLAFGNNDKMDTFKQIFKTTEESNTLTYQRTISGIKVIVLDSSVPRKATGYFTGNQLTWLGNVLQEEPDQPTIIAFHHPINLPQQKLLEVDYDNAQREEFYNTINGSNIIAVLNGHFHHNQVTMVNGILHIQASSILYELSYNDTEYWMRNKYCYNYLMYRNNSLKIKTVSIPCDGRKMQEGSLKALVEAHLKGKR